MNTSVDAALYKDGARVKTSCTLGETYQALHANPGAMAWIELNNPSTQVIESLAREFEFHDLLLEDIIQAHQRPKLERYESTLYVVLHAARYLDKEEEVEFGELHVVLGPDYVVTLRHGGAPDLSGVRTRLESSPDLLTFGPEAVLYAIADAVVDEYAPVTRGLELDIEQIEYQVFSGDPTVSRRIYELSGEVADFQRAVRPLRRILIDLRSGFAKYGVNEYLQSYLRDVEDHLVEVSENTERFGATLKDILTVNATLMTQRQIEEIRALNEAGAQENDAMKRISAWAAIIFAPSLVGGIYGMNFDIMPELHWAFGYPFALGLMLTLAVVLYVVFKKKRWL
ncbi:MAG: magnesium and cobalt transport protein CorA [Coriobacteriales bacterium]|jgi:magnesium transporter|nr:magnesium and cobalt transport protein CorA [Coriobacteriales bacterium]